MTRQEIAILVCRAMAVYLIGLAIVLSGSFGLWGIFLFFGWAFGRSDIDWTMVSATLGLSVPTVVLFVFAACLWKLSPHIGRRMVSDDRTPVGPSNVTKDDVLVLAFTVVGVGLGIPEFHQLARNVLEAIFSNEPFRHFWTSGPWQAEIWSHLLGVLLAAWLAVGARGVVKFILYLRTAGTTNSDFDATRPLDR
jgi:hypothetical protein